MTEIKRQPKRFPVDMPARFRAAEEPGEWLEGRLLNLSEGGLCLAAAAEFLLPGEIVEIVIESVDKKGVPRRRLVRAKVVWRKNGRAGVQFMRSQSLPMARKKRLPSQEIDRGRPKLAMVARDPGEGEDGTDES